MDYFDINFKEGVMMRREIYLKGFEGVGISYDEIIYLLNTKLGLRLKIDDVRNCRDMGELLDLPISLTDKMFIETQIYEWWVERREPYFMDGSADNFKIGLDCFLKQREEKRINKNKNKNICPNCGNKINTGDNYCCHCEQKLRNIKTFF